MKRLVHKVGFLVRLSLQTSEDPHLRGSTACLYKVGCSRFLHWCCGRSLSMQGHCSANSRVHIVFAEGAEAERRGTGKSLPHPVMVRGCQLGFLSHVSSTSCFRGRSQGTPWSICHMKGPGLYLAKIGSDGITSSCFSEQVGNP